MTRITLRKRLGLLLVILAAPIAGVSAAGLIDLGTYNNNSADANAAVQTNVDANAGSNSLINAGVHTDTNANANVQSGQGASSQSGDNSPGQDQNANSQTDVSANADASAGFSLNQDSDEVKNHAGANISADSVATDADLKSFAATELRNDANLSSMGFTSDSVNVAYRQPGRFLGFIPVNMNVAVNVNSDGSISTSYPWYSFLVLSDKGDMEATLKSEISAYLSERGSAGVPNTGAEATSTEAASASVSGNAAFTPSMRAGLADRIEAVLRAHLTSNSGTATTTQSDTSGY